MMERDVNGEKARIVGVGLRRLAGTRLVGGEGEWFWDTWFRVVAGHDEQGGYERVGTRGHRGLYLVWDPIYMVGIYWVRTATAWTYRSDCESRR